jgi:hypothetical protein
MDETCKTCPFYEPDTRKRIDCNGDPMAELARPESGWCNANPTVADAEGYGQWPTTRESFWCGRHPFRPEVRRADS